LTQSRRFESALDMSSAKERYFQLEELKDKETATTELFLKADSTVEFGKMDGPLYIEASSGTWKELPSGEFKMILKRTFEAGTKQETYTNMGEFDFEVERTFTGEMAMVGECVAVTGTMHALDAILGDEEVGYFNMIDTSKERSGEEEES
jgi:hypothetical protein